jgi:hypothetical protein
MKLFNITTVGEASSDERLAAWHARQATLNPKEIPPSLRRYANAASVWGIGCDALRQFHMSKHSMSEIFALYDSIEESRMAFERFWTKLSNKIGRGDLLTTTEDCFWSLQMVHSEISAHILAHGRPKQ